MSRNARTAAWPFLSVLACLFVLSVTAPCAWERIAHTGSLSRRVALRQQRVLRDTESENESAIVADVPPRPAAEASNSPQRKPLAAARPMTISELASLVAQATSKRAPTADASTQAASQASAESPATAPAEPTNVPASASPAREYESPYEREPAACQPLASAEESAPATAEQSNDAAEAAMVAEAAAPTPVEPRPLLDPRPRPIRRRSSIKCWLKSTTPICWPNLRRPNRLTIY